MVNKPDMFPAFLDLMVSLLMCMLSRFSHVQLFATLLIVAHQAPLSLGFSRQEYWSGLPGPPPGDLPDPGMEPVSLMSLKLVSHIQWERERSAVEIRGGERMFGGKKKNQQLST